MTKNHKKPADTKLFPIYGNKSKVLETTILIYDFVVIDEEYAK